MASENNRAKFRAKLADVQIAAATYGWESPKTLQLLLDALPFADEAFIAELNVSLRSLGYTLYGHEENGERKFRIVELASAEFKAALDAYKQVAESKGNHSDKAKKAWMLVIHHAPQSFVDVCGAVVSEMGLLPAPVINEGGEQVYLLEDVAKAAGASTLETAASVREMLKMREELGLPTAGQAGIGLVHTLH